MYIKLYLKKKKGKQTIEDHRLGSISIFNVAKFGTDLVRKQISVWLHQNWDWILISHIWHD